MFSTSRSATQTQKDTTSSLAAKYVTGTHQLALSLVVHEDGSFYFQVLLRSKEAETMETVDQCVWDDG